MKGQHALAAAYATQVPDTYDHVSWRWLVQRDGAKADASLEVNPDAWQSRCFNADDSIRDARSASGCPPCRRSDRRRNPSWMSPGAQEIF